MERLVEAIKICYRHIWGELDEDYLQVVYDICREKGVNISGCKNSNEIIKRIFAFVKYQKINAEKDRNSNSDDKVLDINNYRRKRNQEVYDKLMNRTNVDLVLYNILARELLKFRLNRLKDAPITQYIDEEEACSEEVLFIGLIGSLCKQYFAYGIKDGINKYPNSQVLKEKIAAVINKGELE